MDANDLYPESFHPVFRNKLPDFKTPAVPLSRLELPRPVKYYIADFGLSTRFSPGAPRLVLGEKGADREVPELSDRVPYDPFKTDVFFIGNMLRRKIHDVRRRSHRYCDPLT